MESDSAKRVFMAESAEVLQNMELCLLSLESASDCRENVNDLFRTAHTIKGSSAMIGLDEVAHFTHNVENVLDRLRNDEISVSCDLISLMLACKDHIRELIEFSVEGNIPDDTRAGGEKLSSLLAGYLPDSTASILKGRTDSGGQRKTGIWHISLRFGKDVLKEGMDPMSMINYLSKLGEIRSLCTIHDAMPRAQWMEPEDFYLGFEIDLESDTDKKTIEDTFEFVMEESKIVVIPPFSSSDTYIKMISDLPEDTWMLGDILVRGGVLTREEIDLALNKQTEHAIYSGEKPLIGDVLVREGIVEKEVLNAALEKQQKVRESSGIPTVSTIKVPAEKLDALVNLVGEMVTVQARLTQTAIKSRNFTFLSLAEEVERLTAELRDNTLSIRMLPIGTTFNNFKRLVRDLSKELNKEIEMVTEGADTELDKTVIDKLNDPLVHLIRNCIDHAIELPEQRVAVGKPRLGTIHLSASHSGAHVLIRITDNGKGLDRDAIRQKGIEKNLIGDTADLSDREIFSLIFAPGFSTAKQVTNVSGRGVGMDVVKRSIESLRGTVNLESAAGKGTTVTIKLPLTLAIIDGLLVKVAKDHYVLPLATVVECVALTKKDVEGSGKGELAIVRGEIVPYINLRKKFFIDGDVPDRQQVVITEVNGKRVGFLVDNVIGEYQTVVKKLSSIYKDVIGMSGATILGDGTVAVILDVPKLVDLAEKELDEFFNDGHKHRV
ncbi:MAG: chemotaxis protein CheA [Nitrospirae bacterium]|nr:chemotaxis protein CheA [Nitrospirota bacterium]